MRAPLVVARGQFLIASYAAGVIAIVDVTTTEGGNPDGSSGAAADGFGARLIREFTGKSD
jgi:hypothetical protein